MARVRFQRGTSVIVVDAPAERTWRLPSAGTAGMARILLSRRCAAASSTYINPDGGSPVTIIGEGGSGDWDGVITNLAYTESGIEVVAYQPWVILNRRISQRQGEIVNVTPGFIATLALRDALAGVGGLQIDGDPYECGAPNISFAFSGQDAWSIISSLMQLSDGELHIDATTGDAAWCGPLAYASRYDTLLVAGGNLRGATYRADVQNRVSEVTAVAGTARYTVRRGDTAADGWAAQTSVTAESSLMLAQTANAEIDRRSSGANVIEGGVGSDLWDIRERMFVRVIDPRAGFTGRTHTCRVLARTLTDGADVMGLTLQVIEPVVGTPVTTGAGARLRAVGQAPVSDGSDVPVGTPDATTITQWVRAMAREITYLKRIRTGGG